MSQVILHKKDCLDAMSALEAGSVDLLLTALPYDREAFAGRGKQEGKAPQDNFFFIPGWEELDAGMWLEEMDAFLSQSARVLRGGGSLVAFLALMKVESVAALAEKHGLRFQGAGIWHQKEAVSRKASSGTTEAWLHLTAGDWSGEPLPDFIETGAAPAAERQYGKHPYQKPEGLMDHFLSRLSQSGDWVLDPFMGSGTTGVAAQRSGRNFIGIERDKRYFAMAKARIRGQLQEKPKAIDLFCGVGGLSLGFAWSGFDVVLANESDPEIAAAYQRNHPNTNMLVGDIAQLDLKEVFGPYNGKIDVLLGGPPCQNFSRKAKTGPSWDQYLQYFVQVAELVKPRYLVIEADPHLLTSENGYFRKRLTAAFSKLDYRINGDILNAADYGVPQNRSRAILLGKLGSWAPELPMETGEQITAWDAIGDLAFLASGEGSEEQAYPDLPASAYAKALRGDAAVLYNHVATRHAPVALERMALIPPGFGREVLPEEHLTKSTYSGTWCRMLAGSASVAINTRFDTPASGRFLHPVLNRTITVREAARLQSFPDGYVFTGTKTSQMKQVGTALPPRLAQAIAAVIQQDMEG